MILAAISLRLISALISAETGGVRDPDHALGDYVRGKPTSFGCLQISRKVLTDVSRISGRKLTTADAFRRPTAIWICRTYLDYYATKELLGHDPTDEDRARVWNGGPLGWRKPDTEAYWMRVKIWLDRATFSLERLPVGGDQSAIQVLPAASRAGRPQIQKLPSGVSLSLQRTISAFVDPTTDETVIEFTGMIW